MVKCGDLAVRALPVALDGGHPINVKVTIGKLVWADAERVGQVLRNLLLNPVRHMPEGTRIALAVTEPGEPGARRRCSRHSPEA